MARKVWELIDELVEFFKVNFRSFIWKLNQLWKLKLFENWK
jgi:hypothetical protein